MLDERVLQILDAAEPSRVFWGSEPNARAAIIFVHGYGGDACGTWAGIADSIEEHRAFDGVDLFFWGYDGVSRPIGEATMDFTRFLTWVAEEPSSLLRVCGGPSRRSGFVYPRVIIAAHSLGAIVVRQALVHESRKRVSPTWLERIETVLFAPAHNGSTSLARLLDVAKGSGIPFVNYFAAWMAGPVLRDLQYNSVALNRLRADVEAARTKFPPPTLVVWAVPDDVVENADFPGDPTPEKQNPKNGDGFQNHTAVCKVAGSYSAPIDALARVLGTHRE